MSGLRILIVGGGIAGPCAAWWLGKAGADVTVIERSPAFYKRGQAIDLEAPSEQIVQRMGLLDNILSKKTIEKGISIVNKNDKCVTWTNGGLTKDIEIMRGELAQLLIEAADKLENVRFEFNRTVKAISQDANAVHATFNDGQQDKFDILIAADGLRSRTRDMILDPSETKDCVKPLNNFVAYFSIDRQPQDGVHARWLSAPGGRGLLIRPSSQEKSSAYFTATSPNGKYNHLSELVKSDKQSQKNAIKDLFAGMGGDSDRCLQEMETTDDFYFENLSQIKLNKWSKGRCVLVGDAAFCPSPSSGQGTNLAIWSAYVLAGEIAKNPRNITSAFEAYETEMRPGVKERQALPLGGGLTNILNPQSEWAITTLRLVFRFIVFVRFIQIAEWLDKKKVVPIPDYPIKDDGAEP